MYPLPGFPSNSETFYKVDIFWVYLYSAYNLNFFRKFKVNLAYKSSCFS